MSELNEPVVITGWGIVSAIGIGGEAFRSGFREGRCGLKPVEATGDARLPVTTACVIPEFDATQFLGKKGLRFMSRTTKFSVVTSGMALQDSGISISPENQTRIGLVIGTSIGSPKNVGDFIRDTLVQERPHMVNPMVVPHVVMNSAASQSAIWHKLKGVNATISGGHLAGVQALRYAMLQLRLDYADTMLAGSTEEFCEQLAWGFHHVRGQGDAKPVCLGEGCAIFTLEQRKVAQANGRRMLAELLACEVGFAASDGEGGARRVAEGLAACIRRALDRASISPAHVWSVFLQGSMDEAFSEVEAQGVRLALEGSEPTHTIMVRQLLGECLSAAGSLQIAASLALFSNTPDSSGSRVSLVTSITHSGAVGCALLRECS
jgi:3-oxoacyl-[acyl-carrier-protein] synthase II